MLKQLTTHPALVFGTILVLAFAFVAIAAPLLAPPNPRDPYQIPRDGFKRIPLPPSEKHVLGTLAYQYDVFYGLVWGTRVAFRVGLIVTVGRALLGVLVGLLAGYYGGWVDAILMRITDAFMAIPLMAVAMVMMALYGGTRHFSIAGESAVLGGARLERVIILTLIGFGWMQYARLIRGNVLVERSKEYIDAATSVGVPNLRIAFQHLFPNVTQGLFVLIASDVGAVVVMIAAFGFIGLTGNPGDDPAADWGQILSSSRDWIIGMPDKPFIYWYTYVPASLAVILFAMAWNLIGDGLRDALDPRLNGRRVRASRVKEVEK
jgi:peptide/nickel transport system permease protein